MFNEDLSVFFSTDDFATPATYDGGTINGIFQHQYRDTFEVSSRLPTFLCKAADVPDAETGEAIVINSTNYQIAEVMRDPPGHPGLVMLVLKRA